MSEIIKEIDIEKKLGELVKLAGGLYIKLSPMINNGIPDRIVLFKNSRVFFVELKAGNKKVSKIQIKFHEKLYKLGFDVIIIRSFEDIEKFMYSLEDFENGV